MVVGSVELVPLVDAVGELGELAELFPDTTDWEPYRELYPQIFAESRWRIPCTSYLLRSGGETVLVDTGVGPAGLWGWDAEFEEGLLPALAASGRPARGRRHRLPHPPPHRSRRLEHGSRGRHRLPERALRRAPGRDRVCRACERPAARRANDRAVEFDEIDGETVVAEGITAFPLPGHFPGHMGLRIDSEGERAVLIADAAVNPMLLDEPERVYLSDGDAAACTATRRAILPELVDQDVLAVCGHYPAGGIGRVVTRNGRVVWEAAG